MFPYLQQFPCQGDESINQQKGIDRIQKLNLTLSTNSNYLQTSHPRFIIEQNWKIELCSTLIQIINLLFYIYTIITGLDFFQYEKYWP